MFIHTVADLMSGRDLCGEDSQEGGADVNWDRIRRKYQYLSHDPGPLMAVDPDFGKAALDLRTFPHLHLEIGVSKF